jgi:hypothetical protein
MKTPIEDRDLIKQAPHSPRDRFGGFAILGRTVDKCRADTKGRLGEYHYNCPLDNQLFSFKGVNGAQFEAALASTKTYEDVADWLQANGTRKTAAEIKAWSEKVEATKLKDAFAKHDEADQKEVRESCQKAGLNYDSCTLFDWLEADDQASFELHPQLAEK